MKPTGSVVEVVCAWSAEAARAVVATAAREVRRRFILEAK
jgi:hypothetical protein